ncbi:MAG: protein kinase [Candidatus Obscuribacterales bacterium]|nr:protein kinase [Candidatus Obscuribacterales bacterium]
MTEEQESQKELEADAISFLAAYEKLEEVGSGAASIVYRARHKFIDREIALKIMQPLVSDRAAAVLRFQKEARLSARLNHPNIIKIFAFGLDDEKRCFLAMEFLGGKSLAQELKEKGPLKLSEFKAVFLPLLDALAYAHAEGIVHRDIKPGNIMLQTKEDGNLIPVLVDFGIAQATEINHSGDQKLTATGVVLGSPAYMSPEQCKAAIADERSDLYSLACVIWEALYGQPPFIGENPLEVMYKHINESPQLSGRRISGAAGQKLHNILLKGLAKNSDKRQQSAAELKKELQSCLAELKHTDFVTTNKQQINKVFWILPAFVLVVLVLYLVPKKPPLKQPVENESVNALEEKSPRILINRAEEIHHVKRSSNNAYKLTLPYYKRILAIADSMQLNQQSFLLEDRLAASVACRRLAEWSAKEDEALQSVSYLDKAESYLEKGKKIDEREREELATVCMTKAQTYAQLMKLKEAKEYYERAIDVATAQDGSVLFVGVVSSGALAEYYASVNNAALAEKYYKKTFALADGIGQSFSTDMSAKRLRYARFLIEQKRVEEAKKIIAEVVGDMTYRLPRHYVERAQRCWLAAQYLKYLHEHKKAEAILNYVATLALQEDGERQNYDSKISRAKIFLRLSRLNEAERFVCEAQEMAERSPDEHRYTADGYAWQAYLQWRLNRLAQALESVKKGLAEVELVESKRGQKIKALLMAIQGEVLWQMGRSAEAKDSFAKVFEGTKPDVFASDSLYWSFVADYAKLLRKSGDFKTAKEIEESYKTSLLNLRY